MNLFSQMIRAELFELVGKQRKRGVALFIRIVSHAHE